MKVKTLTSMFLFIIFCFIFFSCPSAVKEEKDKKDTTFIPTWPFDYNFDANNGDWTATGDWEWTSTYNFANYTGNYFPPTLAHSGTGLWGTIIYNDYNNSGSSSYLS
ncbi:MAG: hypothetical protein JXB50_15575, partial [Spirochaetes bacterium]|nr:hypothetical protein [Spirochaetota bacterium]